MNPNPRPDGAGFSGSGSLTWCACSSALPFLLLRTTRAAGAAAHSPAVGDDSGTRPFAGPHTRFDDPLTPHRWFAYEIFDLAEIKKVGHAFGASVNDVMVAMAAGALRTYLHARRRTTRHVAHRGRAGLGA